MKKTHIALILAASIPFSTPALAGPNWDVIHKAEADKAAHKHEHALVLPLDYGPRAITTPWLNQERLRQQNAQLEAQQGEGPQQKNHAGVAGHAHQRLASHS